MRGEESHEESHSEGDAAAAARAGTGAAAAAAEAAISLADNPPDVLSRFDRDLRYVYVNRTIERYTGIPREAFLGRTYRELGFPEENCVLWDGAIRHTFASGEPSVIEFAVPLPDGLAYCEGFAVAERGRDGAIESVLTVTRDITDRVRALERLREGDERLRLAVEAAAVGTWDYDTRTGQMLWDDRCRALLGVSPDAPASYAVFRACLHPDDRVAVDAAVERALDPGGDGSLEIEYRALSDGEGSERWIRAKGRAIFDAPGARAVRLLGTVIDVTGEKRAEAALRRAADIFRFTSQPVSVGSNRSATIELCNPAFARLYGYETPEEMIGHPVVSIYAPEERGRVAALIQEANEAGHATFAARHVRRDGTVFPVVLDVTVVRDEAGRVLYRIVNVTDVTERRRAEAERAEAGAALAESDARLRQALSAARMGMWDWEVASGRLTWAGHLEEIHGMPPGSFDGRFETYAERIHEEDRAGVLAIISRALQEGGHFAVEFRVTYPDGSTHWVAGDGRAEHDESGNPVRMIGMGWDITEVKRAQEAARIRAEDARRTAEEERQRAEREALLNRIGEALRAARDPAQVRDAAVRELGRALGVDRCCYAEIGTDESGADWQRRRRRQPDGDASAAARDAVPVLAEALNARPHCFGPDGILCADDLAETGDGAFTVVGTLATLGLRAAAGIALFDGTPAPVAALVVGMTRSPRSWTTDETELIRAVASMVRDATEDARQRHREHNIAERLQAALQPTLLDQVPGLMVDAHYQPALSEATIGGDFFDVFTVERGRRAALVVADLSGKGLAAAAQVATLRHMLRTLLYLHRGTTLATSLTALDHLIGEHALLAGFATVFVATYDADEHTLTYVNAGQEPALLRRAATGAVEELWPTGPVLAGFPGAPPYEERTITLASGDVLAIFTDGLTEAGPSRSQLLGVEGVSTIFQESADDASSVSRIARRLVRGVEAQATPGGIRDDVCLLVARVT